VAPAVQAPRDECDEAQGRQTADDHQGDQQDVEQFDRGGGRCSELDRERGAWVPVGVVPAAARARHVAEWGTEGERTDTPRVDVSYLECDFAR
jgi:hypothetical protein